MVLTMRSVVVKFNRSLTFNRSVTINNMDLYLMDKEIQRREEELAIMIAKEEAEVQVIKDSLSK